jgi:hypothetical protein
LRASEPFPCLPSAWFADSRVEMEMRTVATTLTPGVVRTGFLARLNGSSHYKALLVYLAVVIAHWLEHFVQALQIYVFGVPRPQAGGVLGTLFPWLISSEALHWGYAAFMLAGLAMLRGAFSGEGRKWWNIALGIQVWHFIEHLLLAVQAWSGWHLAGKPVPTSVIQLVMPRVELHLIYNMIVLIPLLTAISLHWFRTDGEGRKPVVCTCATHFPQRAD